MPLAERLREETREHHARLEALPCFQALSSQALPPESHRALHQVLALLYQELTWALATVAPPVLAVATTDVPPLHPLLDQDLLLEVPQGVLQSHALIGAVALGERMRSAAHREPLSLLGSHYALRLALFPLPGTSPWVGFARLLEGVALGSAEETGLIRAVRETFSWVRSLFDALHPSRALPSVWWLNRDAGTHPITTDLDELRAALRAAESTWEEFPYYAWRYGEHGRHFSWSDSAWLVTLGARGEEEAWRHISWLGRLLAARGMPRFMLERHLWVLHQELVRAKPARQELYDVLRRMAERMAEERRRFIDDQMLRLLEEDFESRVAPAGSLGPQRTGELLVAAVVDACCGIAQAIPSISSWMCDPSRFSRQWIGAVEETLARASALCQSRSPS